MKSLIRSATATLLAVLSTNWNAAAFAQAPAATTPARPPAWAERGAYVFRISTPDAADVLPRLEQGHAMVANLLDRSVPQVTMVAGLIGHDHPGAWNWDGLWPYWNRATYRAGSFAKLSDFMVRTKKNWNVQTGFHLNLTDANIGLRDYPESRAFFQRLVETKSIYRRDLNESTRQRDGAPYVPTEIDRFIRSQDGKAQPDPVPIFALVNYQKFWDSGLAREVIDGFYQKLPYAPPMLYLDVLNLSGGNFSTGYPDGPLGGSKETQTEGVRAIVDYLRRKGTDLGTEGNRDFLGRNAADQPRAGYVWYHGAGYSKDDYSVITGGSRDLAGQQVLGNAGAFNVSPVASTQRGLGAVKAHYAALLAGQPGTKSVPGLGSFRIALRDNDKKDEFDIPGTGDAFRGDWADLVNNFYLTAIQESYHIGKRNVRVSTANGRGTAHVGVYRLSLAGGPEIKVSLPDLMTDWGGPAARKEGFRMMEDPIETKVLAPKAGAYSFHLTYRSGGGHNLPVLNAYVNGRLHMRYEALPVKGREMMEVDLGPAVLREGENVIAFDSGAIQARWSDGTEAQWTTPYLRKGFKAWNGDVVFADDYDRMWPDTWSGQKKIYFFSWEGTSRSWKLPLEWRLLNKVTLLPLTPEGRGQPVSLSVYNGNVAPKLLPQVPYIIVSN